MRPDGEGRWHARQQRRVADTFSGLEDVYDLVLMTQLDRAAQDDEELICRRAILNQNVGAGRIGPHRDGRRDMQQFVPG